MSACGSGIGIPLPSAPVTPDIHYIEGLPFITPVTHRAEGLQFVERDSLGRVEVTAGERANFQVNIPAEGVHVTLMINGPAPVVGQICKKRESELIFDASFTPIANGIRIFEYIIFFIRMGPLDIFV